MGDRVLLHGEPAHIETVTDPAEQPDDWFAKELGGGVMIAEPKSFGRLFLTEPHEYEDLTFMSRNNASLKTF